MNTNILCHLLLLHHQQCSQKKLWEHVEIYPMSCALFSASLRYVSKSSNMYIHTMPAPVLCWAIAIPAFDSSSARAILFEATPAANCSTSPFLLQPLLASGNLPLNAGHQKWLQKKNIESIWEYQAAGGLVYNKKHEKQRYVEQIQGSCRLANTESHRVAPNTCPWLRLKPAGKEPLSENPCLRFVDEYENVTAPDACICNSFFYGLHGCPRIHQTTIYM